MGKKILTGLLSLLFVFIISQRVDAAEITADGGSVSVPVTYTADTTAFVITIPAVITPSDVKQSFSIGASYMNLRPEQHIEVRVSKGCAAGGTVTLRRQNVADGKPAATLDTVLSVDGTTIDKNDFLVGYFCDGSESSKNILGDVSMSPLNVTSDTEAGDYTAALEFTVALKS